ncbi:MAG: alpha/beta hydrolase, partial [Ramlibacter sp.]
RGFERSTQPSDVKQYRAKYLVQDIAALIEAEGAPLECLIAHDWGGAVAWNLANQMPQLTKKLAIINSPHPGTFLRDLQNSPAQQAASEYMNFLIRPDAEQLLRADDYKMLWGFFTRWGGAPWLTESVKKQYRAVWDASLNGGLNYYRASPLRPPRPEDPAAATITLPREVLTVDLPTLVLWGMEDAALPPGLVDGLDEYVSRLTLEKVEGASHWVVHERPQFIAERLGRFLAA